MFHLITVCITIFPILSTQIPRHNISLSIADHFELVSLLTSELKLMSKVVAIRVVAACETR